MSWHYFSRLVIPEALVSEPLTARLLLTENLRAIHAAGMADKDVNPVLLLDPESATATAYRFGVHRTTFDLDAILSAAGHGRRRYSGDNPERTVEFLLTTGGTGESYEDNHDMVGVA